MNDHLIHGLSAYGGMNKVAKTIQTADGAQLAMPVTDAAAEEGARIDADGDDNTPEKDITSPPAT